MAARRGRSYMKWVRSHRRSNRPHRRRRRSNPFPVAGVVANPHRRRRRRSNPVFRRRRSSGGRGMSLMGFSLPPLNSVLYAGVGFIGAGAIEHFVVPYLPVGTDGKVSPAYTWAVRIGSVIGLSFLAKAVLGGDKAKTVAVGGGAYVLVKAASDLLPLDIKSQIGLTAYRPLSAYRQLNGPDGRLNLAGVTNPQNQSQTMGATAQRFRRF